jgi:hypothetical protein
MKKPTITMIATAVITAGLFSAVLFTACTKKNPCSGITCYNNGTCNGGICSCPSGWTGTNCQTSTNTTITYQNNAFTPVTIVNNGNSQVIQPGSTVSYTGSPNSTLTITASTSGMSTTGTQIGLKVTWNINNTFPATGTSNYNIDVSSDYFYLEIKNGNSSATGTTLYTNYQLDGQTTDYLSIPNNNVTYGIGYYSSGITDLYLLSNTSLTWTYFPTFPGTANQYFLWPVY